MNRIRAEAYRGSIQTRKTWSIVRGQEVAMPESQPESTHPQPLVRRQERVVHESEYRTSYFEFGQIRMSPKLYERLEGWARTRGIAPGELLIQILEEAVRRRGG
ncbi:MAG: hypothetical protein U0790_25945 [Isosphaeraceae bacterium]